MSGSIEAMMRSPYRPIDPRRYDVKEDYKHYVQEIGSALKYKKSRVELEREKQMAAQHEIGIADQIYNSRTHQDHQQK
jgi:hypothetical protein